MLLRFYFEGMISSCALCSYQVLQNVTTRPLDVLSFISCHALSDSFLVRTLFVSLKSAVFQKKYIETRCRTLAEIVLAAMQCRECMLFTAETQGGTGALWYLAAAAALSSFQLSLLPYFARESLAVRSASLPKRPNTKTSKRNTVGRQHDLRRETLGEVQRRSGERHRAFIQLLICLQN